LIVSIPVEPNRVFAMSDNWITLIPETPNFIPGEAAQAHAGQLFWTIAPDSDQIDVNVFDKLAFFACGANFERILCPACGSEIPTEWWQDRMDEDFDNGFKLTKYATPCCSSAITLHELNYDWPQGFGRFSLDAMNPKIGLLDDEQKKAFEEILGTRLRVIYQHI